MIIILGYVSVQSIATDLLPSVSLPYMVVITPYPGASPERVESQVAAPLERSLGTVTNVKNVTTNCMANYCVTQLEFEDGTDMESATVKVSGAAGQVKQNLPDGVGTPSIMEISMDMIATMYIAVSREGYDIYQLSSFADETLKPRLERVEGVASVTGIGLVEKSVQIDLDADKIEQTKKRVIKNLEKSFDEAGSQLEEALEQAQGFQDTLNYYESIIGSTVSDAVFAGINDPAKATAAVLSTGIQNVLELMNQIDAGNDAAVRDAIAQSRQRLITAREELQKNTYAALIQGVAYMREAIAELEKILGRLEQAQELSPEQIAAFKEALRDASEQLDNVPQTLASLQENMGTQLQSGLDSAIMYAKAAMQVGDVISQLQEAQTQFETAKENALSGDRITALISAQNLSQIIYAQNLAMPAGYIDDKEDTSWLLKIGEEYENADEIADMVLLNNETTGIIRLKDVAVITVIDNALDTYTRLNGQDGIVLSMYKSSASGTNEVSRACKEVISQLTEEYDGTEVVVLMDQGEYIDLIVGDILKSMLLGAVLAIIVLALFLRSIKPTVMVAVSIPLSVFFTLVLMYFTDLSMNIMTLSGLALGIGMLVDNSIVVMENIIRLRARGVSPGNAAVQGARQVAGAIIASTLTTICVFVPMLFTTGTVRELLLPMALSITYCLTASLIVSMTVVPASASVLLRRQQPSEKSVLDYIYDRYEKALRFCLGHKWVPLTFSVGALAVCVFLLLRMGIIMLPEMSSGQIEVNLRTEKGLTREESYACVDEAMEKIMQVDGVVDIGIMDTASSTQLISSFNAGGSSYGQYMGYVTVDDKLSVKEVAAICEDIEETISDLGLSVNTSTGGMADMNYMVSSGLTVTVYGINLEEMHVIAKEVAAAIETIDGFVNVSDGTARTEQTLVLNIDKNKAMEKGITVAQIYAGIAARMKTEVSSTTITENDIAMKVNITDNTNPLTKENILDMEFESNTQAGTGLSGGMSDSWMSGQSGMDPLEMGSIYGGTSGTGAAFGAGGMTNMTGNWPDSFGAGDVDELADEDADKSQEKDNGKFKLGEIATITQEESPVGVNRKNLTRYITVSADTLDGYNTTLLSRKLEKKLEVMNREIPNGYSVAIEGETLQVGEMVTQMVKLLLMAFSFIYLVMVAQFQSFRSPFIIIFTIPLAFTGGLLGLLLSGEQLSVLSLMGFLVLMGTVVNNGIVFVDYVNQLRIGSLTRRDALVATGRTRMRPILMTALTTILAMGQLIFGVGIGAQMTRGMAVVIAGGLLYATLMTLFIIPVIYDIIFKKEPHNVLIDDDLDLLPDDAKAYLQSKGKGEQVLDEDLEEIKF